MNDPRIEIRLLQEDDSIPALTQLLRRAYQPLADRGWRFVATWQDDELTRKRAMEGECYLLFLDGNMVGTITVRGPNRDSDAEYYRRDGVWSFGMFGVEPHLKGQGLGSRMMEHVEQRAKELGAREMALDTAVPAEHLIRYYESHGYRIVDRVQWSMTNFPSVIMAKDL